MNAEIKKQGDANLQKIVSGSQVVPGVAWNSRMPHKLWPSVPAPGARELLGHKPSGSLMGVTEIADLLGADAATSSLSGRQQLHERYYSGNPVRLAGMLSWIYNRDTDMDRINHLLDRLEQRPALRPALRAAE